MLQLLIILPVSDRTIEQNSASNCPLGMLRLLSADAAAVKAVILSLSPRFNAIAMTDITQNDGLLIFTILKHLSPSGQSLFWTGVYFLNKCRSIR